MCGCPSNIYCSMNKFLASFFSNNLLLVHLFTNLSWIWNQRKILRFLVPLLTYLKREKTLLMYIVKNMLWAPLQSTRWCKIHRGMATRWCILHCQIATQWCILHCLMATPWCKIHSGFTEYNEKILCHVSYTAKGPLRGVSYTEESPFGGVRHTGEAIAKKWRQPKLLKEQFFKKPTRT